MITGMPISEMDQIFSDMGDSGFDFHLTGSRRFGGVKPGSDWDFFVEYSPDVTKFLVSLGFEVAMDEESNTYLDACTMEVWLHPLYFIHIQIIKPEMFSAKVNVNEFLTRHRYLPCFQMEKFSPAEKHTIWYWLINQHIEGKL